MSENSPETSNEVIRAQVPGATDADLRIITLAHPLTRQDDFNALGLDWAEFEDQKGIPAGRQVAVRPDHAQSLIGAGYAVGVNPDKDAEVRKIVSGEKDAPSDVEQPTDPAPGQTVNVEPSQADAEALDSKDQPPATADGESGGAGAAPAGSSDGGDTGTDAGTPAAAAAPKATKTAAAKRAASPGV